MKAKGPRLAQAQVWNGKLRPIDGSARRGIHYEGDAEPSAWYTRDRSRDHVAEQMVPIFEQLHRPRSSVGYRLRPASTDTQLVEQLRRILQEAAETNREMLQYACTLVRDNLRWLIRQRSFRRSTYDALMTALEQLQQGKRGWAGSEIAALRQHIINVVNAAAAQNAPPPARPGASTPEAP